MMPHVSDGMARFTVGTWEARGWWPFPADHHDQVALTIASWWQSPGGDGIALTELSTTGMADAVAVMDAIDRIRRHESLSPRNKVHLTYLGAWVLERRHEPYPHHAGRLIGCRGCHARCYCGDLLSTVSCVRCEGSRH